MNMKELKPLLRALDAGYLYRPHQMLSYFLDATMGLWGLPLREPVPEDIKSKIGDAIEAYGAILTRQAPFQDVLGPLYMEMASHGAKAQLAQYFTPWSIARMMALVNMAPAPDEPMCRTCDPTCGSGVMLLAFANVALERWGVEGLQKLSLTGVDLDATCARMTAVQLIAWCNMTGMNLGEIHVLQGNSLLPWECLKTVVHAQARQLRAPIVEAPALEVLESTGRP